MNLRTYWLAAGVAACGCSDDATSSAAFMAPAPDMGLSLDAGGANDLGVADTGPIAPTFVFDPTRDLPYPEAVGPCMDAHLADLDDDGDLDVVLAFEGPANVLLENDGAGRFSVRPSAALSLRTEDSEDVVAFDANGDRYPDLLFVSEDLGGENEIYLSSGPFDYVAGPTLPGAGTTNGLAVGDVNGDDILDAVLGNAGTNFVWLGDGRGGFSEAASTNVPPSTFTAQDVELGDIDGDGDLDLAIGNDNGPNRLWRNDEGRFVDVTESQLPPDRPAITREVDFADVDDDNDLDLFFANVRFSPTANPNNALLLNDGAGNFSYADEGQLPLDDLTTLDGDFVDLDGDEDLDLVTANSRVSSGLFPAPYRAYQNNGSGRFEDVTDTWLPGRYEGLGLDVEVGDLDGDGVPDIYLCGRSSADRVLFGRWR